MRSLPVILSIAALAILSACAQPKTAPAVDVTRVAYTDTEHPTSLTLMTMISNRNGSGGHTALLINASQRVIWDPAGTWWNKEVPETNDVLYGINPAAFDLYLDYHARPEYRVVMQTINVSPEVAEQALRAYAATGAAAKATCANRTSAVLNTLPGFQGMPHTWYPRKLMEAFGTLPGVQTSVIFDDVNEDQGIAPGDYRTVQGTAAITDGIGDFGS